MLLHSVVANISSKSRERVGNYDKNAIIGQRAFKTPAAFDWCTRPDQLGSSANAPTGNVS